jgi:cell division protein FtsQ
MAGMVSVTRTVLKQRRQKLRRRRQVKVIQAIWRTLAISALASSLLWVAIQPIWVLRSPEQIEISGNQLLSTEGVKSKLKISYPQSLFKIEPSIISQLLQQQPTITQATVSRRLLPPGLVVKVWERVPVAVIKVSNQGYSGVDSNKTSVSLLDAKGIVMPFEKNSYLNPSLKLPNLKVIGTPEKYRSLWNQVYPAISESSVKITEIDFQNPANLILKTEIGSIHVGSPGQRLPEQIRTISKIRHLPRQLNPSQIDYIDLRNPKSPLVQMN